MAELLTAGKVARLAECSPDTIRRLVDQGQIPAIKASSGLRLIERADAEAFAKQRATRVEERRSR